ncbi:MAG: GNAT family N-acetyltransferase [Parvularculaceae bacterium]|nr:GNAT family N-acetyltransferase [Parvularculaceae bacterium]
MSLTVRKLEAGDEAGWRRLWAGYLAFYRAELAEATTAEIFARLVKGEPHFAFVAECDGALAGFVHALPHASTWALEGYCYLEDLFVDSSVRGAGIGRALIEAVYEEAERRGLSRVYWHTEEGNATARRLYDRVATLSEFIQYRHAKH